MRVSFVVTVNHPWRDLVAKVCGRSQIVSRSVYVADPPCMYSPEDHAILETEYQMNPKPDKVARMQIVKRVALGEKEVQVSDFRADIEP